MENIPQTVHINAKEFFRKTMILTSYEVFAQLIAKTVAEADEPDVLAESIRAALDATKVQE